MMIAAAPATSVLSIVHRLVTAALVLLGLALIYLGADWVTSGSNSNWAFGIVLALVGAQAVLLSTLASDDLAASVVAIAWTAGTALLFMLVLNSPMHAYVLSATAVAQALVTLVAYSLPGARRRRAGTSDPSVVFEPPSPAASSRYGALSSFVDPLSTSARMSPSTSPQLQPARTPSPFGTRSSPIRPGVSASAARMPLPSSSAVSSQTPADVRAHYTSLVDKYGLGSTPPS